MAAPNLAERIGAREKCRTGHGGDGLFAGIDEIGVLFAGFRERADAEQSVFGLKRHVNSFGNVIRDEGGDSNTKIDVVAVAQFLRGALRHQIANWR